jgi:lipoprotein-anchoring transpeptidase ErfK/SrfK
MKNKPLSRRDFIKLTGLGLISFLGPNLSPFKQPPTEHQGRVIYENISVYSQPSFDAERIRLYWKDMVIPITRAAIGGKVPAYNRVWYRIGQEGYAHSGGIQPVKTEPQPLADSIPARGSLAEVTVPYTDALWNPDVPTRVAYRFYYETTHWITDIVENQDGKAYYKIQEDKWDLVYYVEAAHLRLVPPEELQLISPDLPPLAKRIEVLLDTQLVVAYEWNKPVFITKVATGAKFSSGNHSTPPGYHITNYKRPSRHMAAGNLAYNGYDLPGVPWTTYITKKGVAFHGTYWHNDFGKPRSHGCINMSSKAAKWLYLWCLPHVPPSEESIYQETGTSVNVID